MNIATRISRAAGDASALLALTIELAQENAQLEARAKALKGADEDRRAIDAARTRRRRALAPDVSPELRSLVFQRDSYTCCLCDDVFSPLHADHIIAVARGGQTELDNLQTLCEQCNWRKGAR